MRKATNHSVVKEPRRADQVPLETSANGDSDIEESEDEKNLATRQVKRTISLDEEESTRPARRPVSTSSRAVLVTSTQPDRQKKNVKHAEMEKTADKVGIFSHRLLSSPRVGARPQVHQRRRQTSDKTGSFDRDGVHCFCLWFQRICLWSMCAGFLSV